MSTNCAMATNFVAPAPKRASLRMSATLMSGVTMPMRSMGVDMAACTARLLGAMNSRSCVRKSTPSQSPTMPKMTRPNRTLVQPYCSARSGSLRPMH